MRTDPECVREFWLLDEMGQVSLVSREEYEQAEGNLRFSNNICLRRPSSTNFLVRGMLAAFVDKDFLEALTGAFGESLRFASADIAVYQKGQFLRRHNDDFEKRRLALILFLSEGWTNGCGGELVVESRSGRSRVFSPISGDVALLRFNPDAYHQVAEIVSEDWERVSIAVHFRGV